jgi:hypothetical protein
MSVKKFKFVSPGVQVKEIDNSQVSAEADDIGALVIGRAPRGPGMRPVQVSSFSEFIEIFGNPVAGGAAGDGWRDKDQSAPMYGMYAAEAYLKNSSPLTYVRLLGEQHPRKVAGGEAGWMTRDNSGNANLVGSTGGGAYGLFIVPSSSFTEANSATGSLAAVWYCNTGYVRLSGAISGKSDPEQLYSASVGMFFNSQANQKAFTAEIMDATDGVLEKVTFNFTPTSDQFIRKVFNTNPTLTNTNLTNDLKTYHLGETFERHVNEEFYVDEVAASTNDAFGVILPLKLSDTAQGIEQADMRMGTQNAKTGWFFSQELTPITGSTLDSPLVNNYAHSSMQNLFRFVTLDTGEWVQSNLKISIEDIRASQNDFNSWGTFNVVVRDIRDKDSAVREVERFNAVNLNPNSTKYIGKVIGDTYTTWDDDEDRYREYGNHPNQSKFIRVEMNVDVDNGTTNPSLLPFGVYGPPRFKSITFRSGSGPENTDAYYALPVSSSEVPGQPTEVSQGSDGEFMWFPVSSSVVWTFKFPTTYLRVSSSDGDLQSHKSAYFGYDNGRSKTNEVFDASVKDVVRAKPVGVDSYAASTYTEYGYVFTLDDVTQSGSSGGESIAPDARYLSGSRAAGTSITAVSASYRAVLDAGFDKFTTTFHGGFDGLDIQEAEPFNNTRDLASTATELNSYAYYSVKRALDCVSDPEVVEHNIMAMPGIVNTSLNDYMIRVAEDRGDTMAVIDLPSAYTPRQDNGKADVRFTPAQTISAFRTRGLNSSYAATYYPWVQIRDTINDQVLWAPPSIVGLGVISRTQQTAEPWFAPSGFNRGGLTDGHAGIPVTNIREKLTSKERDNLYEANINPIASFPSQGIVVFGQKTLQLTPSALDRINVRRLLLFVKRGISQIANSILFDQNVETTWSRFRAKADRFLSGVKTRLGLEDFKFVLDKSTTTPDLQDRNILYAQVFLKPAKAIEFIAVDFNITNSGASFID